MGAIHRRPHRPSRRNRGPAVKLLRGTALDIFGYSEDRRTERRLIRDYEALVAELIDRLSPDNHGLAVALAETP
ncbi:MAG: DUF6537 domain-containing protein, partial [Pseudomonadota bacterium]